MKTWLGRAVRPASAGLRCILAVPRTVGEPRDHPSRTTRPDLRTLAAATGGRRRAGPPLGDPAHGVPPARRRTGDRRRGRAACRWPAAAGSPTPTSTTAPPPRRCGWSRTPSTPCWSATPACTAAPAGTPRSAPSLYEGAREPVRDFVGGRADDAVIFTRHTTDSFNLLAHCLPARTTVVVFETEHHAALLPWGRTGAGDRASQTSSGCPRPARPREAIASVDDALRRRAPGPALLVITGASNVTGELWPVAELAAVARARGARIALDAAQLAPHRPFSIAELGVDYVALSGHKLYAPYGAGALIGRADWLAAAPPYLIGGGATASVTDDETTLQAAAGPARGRLAERPRRRRAGHRLPRAGHRRPGGAGARRARADRDAAPRTGRDPRRHRAFAVRRRGGQHRRGHLHHRRPAAVGGRRGPVGRARHRRPGRCVLRPPAGPAPARRRRVRRRRRHRAGAAGLGRPRHHHRARRSGWSAAVESIAASGPRRRYVVVDGRPVPAVDDRDAAAASRPGSAESRCSQSHARDMRPADVEGGPRAFRSI